MSLAIFPIDTTSRPPAPRRPHPDIEHHETLRDGTAVLIRSLHAGDREMETDFIRDLSPHSRRLRFLCDFKQPSDALLDQLMDVDHDRRVALIALVFIECIPREIGVARYGAAMGDDTCECAIVVADAWQHRGLGTLLMRHLIEEARSHGFTRMISIDTATHQAMRSLASAWGVRRHLDPEDPSLVIHSLDLQALPS
jgi:GNAT superfamily N-acetyltransferase